ncbi:MAG TPA: ATP-dependent helicase [Gemmatimonadaceae bacterium]|nr:ATP-dependent helicase [Gemmatimonadaceae bacterium]
MTDELRIYPRREREIAPATRDFSAELNAEQLAAATHGDGALLVIAGAGTGKTRTLVYRVAHLIDRGIAPERILLLTFTRRAAHEMLSRAERLVGSASTRVHGGTFHAIGHRLLRQYGKAAGLPSDFSIMDQGDAEDLMGIARANLGVGKKDKRFPKKETLHWIYSRHVNTEIPVDDVIHERAPQYLDHMQDIVRVFADYISRKQERALVDYDDLLLCWALMLEQSPQIAQRIAGMYDHVLIDEYQDTNQLQSRILRGMCRVHRNITVVGDDAQSIYSFRGATQRNILDFPKHFPGTKLVTLEQNYRSTQPILDATNTLISRAPERFTKNLWTRRPAGERPWLVTVNDEHEQTRFVVDRILELHEEGIPLREIAVLIRAGYMSADLEIELANRNIPFEKWGGLKFLEAAHVKDVIAFLRVIENPRDEVSWYRVLMLMPGIGDTTARGLIASMADRGWDLDALTRWTAPARARDAHKALSQLLRRLRGTVRGDATAPEHRVAAEIDVIRQLYDDLLRERYDHPEPRLADLDQLRVIAAGFPTRAAFLSTIALEPPQSTQDLAEGSGEEDDNDALILTTAHSAKGKEWDVVFVIWAVDGWFPMARATESEDELEEERRLMYVAMTRARNELAVVYPVNVYNSRRGADYSMDQLSRFIDRGVREKMQRVAVAPPADLPASQPAPVEHEKKIDLFALLRGRFSGAGSGDASPRAGDKPA